MRTFVWTVVLSLMLIFAWSPVSADTTSRLGLNRTNSADLNATIDAIDAGTAWMGQDLTINPVIETNSPSVVFQDGDNTDDDNNVTLDAACTTTTTGAEDCDLTITQQVAGTAKNAAVFDADLNIAFMPQNILDVINNATGNVDITLRDYADTTDDDQAHTILRTNCTTATTGAEDCDFTILVPEAGAALVSRFMIDADGGTTIGAATNDLVTLTTDSTGDAEVVVPDSSIGQDEIVGLIHTAIFCGDLGNGTVYTSPITGFAGDLSLTAGLTATDLDYALAGTGCDAQDNGTEATADEVMFANTASKVIGLYCAVTGSGSNGVTLNVRSAAASLTPDVTLTIATGDTTGAAAIATTTDIAAGATWAVRAVTTEDLTAQAFWCQVTMMLQP